MGGKFIQIQKWHNGCVHIHEKYIPFLCPIFLKCLITPFQNVLKIYSIQYEHMFLISEAVCISLIKKQIDLFFVYNVSLEILDQVRMQ